MGTLVCFGPDKNAEGRSLYLYVLRNRHVGIVVGEVVVRFCDLRLETHPASLKRGPLPDIFLPPILYAIRIPPKVTDIMGPPLPASIVSRPEASAAYQIFFVVKKLKVGFFKFCIPSLPRNNKYSTPWLPRCATELPPPISKKHHSAQLELW
jgi:hypothetical protein